MHQNHTASPRPPAWQLFTLVALLLTAGIGLAAFAAVWIMEWARLGGPIGEYLAEKGADRVMRRCIMAVGLIFLGIFLKIAGWRGRRDCGFGANPLWLRQLGRGLLIGVATLGGMSLAAWLLDFRIITPPADWAVMPAKTVSFLLSGITVGLLEEIICRGILFRISARIWRPWPAAVISSAIFALAHFLSPAPEAFEAASPGAAAWQVYLDTFANIPRTDAFLLRFVNLTLLGIVLCAFLMRTGALWQSIGAHAAWVWVIKFHHFFTETNRARPTSIWFGTLADFTDSLLAAIMLLAVLLAAIIRRRAVEPPVAFRHHGWVWQAAPEQADRLRDWLTRHWPAAGAAGPPPFTQNSGGGHELKHYRGCRVTSLDGLVIKAYWPRRRLWNGWHLRSRAGRARRGFDLARLLTAAGIPTAPALGWCAAWRGGKRRAEYLATAELAAEPLAQRLARPELPLADRAALMADYGRLAAAFHRNKYSNRDLKYENVMAGGDPIQRWAVDLDGVRRHWRITRRRARRDLFRVGDCLASRGWAAPADTEAFFAGYNSGVPPRVRRRNLPARP